MFAHFGFSNSVTIDIESVSVRQENESHVSTLLANDALLQCINIRHLSKYISSFHLPTYYSVDYYSISIKKVKNIHHGCEQTLHFKKCRIGN